MSRVNPLTNRKVKIGGKVYNSLINQGYVDDGTILRVPSKKYKVQNHSRTVEEGSDAYDKFIFIGYTPQDIDGTPTLVAPELSGFSQRYEFKISDSDFHDGVLKMEKYTEIQVSFLKEILTDFNKQTFIDMTSGKYGKILIIGRDFKNRSKDIFKLDSENKDFKRFKMSVQHYIYGWLKKLRHMIYKKRAAGEEYSPIITYIDVKFQANLLSEFGVLYHNIDEFKNCVIKLYKEHMESQGKPDENIDEMFDKFKDGFFQVDFEYLARKINAKIHVSSPLSKTVYGAQSKGKNLYVSINNNHATLSKTKEKKIKKEEIWVDDIDHYVKDVIYNPDENGNIVNYQKGVMLRTDKKIYKNKIYKFYNENYDNGFKEFSAQGIDFSFYSETGYFKKLFLRRNCNLQEIDKTESNKNLDAIKSISQHGIHFTIDETLNHKENRKGNYYTYDLKKAYTNFHTWRIYEGIPTDLDSCVNSNAWQHQRDDILKYTGFCLIEYVDIYNKQKIERWVSIPYVKMLIRQNRLFSFKYALISRNRVNLDLTDFDNADKREWHKVLGSLNVEFKKESFCTTDPLIAYAGLGAQKNLVKSQDTEIMLYHVEKILDKPGNYYYPHVSSYIQFYTEIMLEELAFAATNKGGKIISVWVDEITVDVDMTEYLNSMSAMDHFHTDKISKVQLTGNECTYRTPVEPQKYSKKFNTMMQDKGNYMAFFGEGGTGKTHMIKELQEQTPMTILTPTHEAGQLYANLNIGYRTVAGFIIETQKTNKKIHELIVMDEGGMNEKSDGYCVHNNTTKGVITVGDKYQLPPVKGESFIDNLPPGYNITELTKNYRQIDDVDFARKLSILRMNQYTDEKFGTIIDESEAVRLGKTGGIIACHTNERVNHFNLLCNDGPEFKEGSRVRFNENRLKLGYHKGLLGIIKKSENLLLVITKKNTYELSKVIEHIELAYGMTVHKLQGKTLDQPLIYDDRRPMCKNIKYVAYSRVVKESNLYIIKSTNAYNHEYTCDDDSDDE